MPYANTSRLARLRMSATGEPYQTALQAVRARPTGDLPVIAEGIRSQEALEAAIVDSLSTLREQDRPGASRNTQFGIRSVVPETARLTVELEPGSDLTRLVTDLMPVVFDGSVGGVPGLRARRHPFGTLLYRPGRLGEVLVRGVSRSDWESAHRDAFAVPHGAVGCADLLSPDAWLTEEIATERDYPRRLEYTRIQAAVLRRICAFNDLAPSRIATWAAPLAGHVIEVVPRRYSHDEHDQLIRILESPHLSPRLICVERRLGARTPELEASRSIYFEAVGHPGELEVRIINPGHGLQLRSEAR